MENTIIPLEIQQHIISYLKPEQQFICKFVCNSWNDSIKATKCSLLKYVYGSGNSSLVSWAISIKLDPKCLDLDLIDVVLNRKDWVAIKILIHFLPHDSAYIGSIMIGDIVSIYPSNNIAYIAAYSGNVNTVKTIMSTYKSNSILFHFVRGAIRGDRIDVLQYLTTLVIKIEHHKYISFSNWFSNGIINIMLPDINKHPTVKQWLIENFLYIITFSSQTKYYDLSYTYL